MTNRRRLKDRIDTLHAENTMIVTRLATETKRRRIVERLNFALLPVVGFILGVTPSRTAYWVKLKVKSFVVSYLVNTQLRNLYQQRSTKRL